MPFNREPVKLFFSYAHEDEALRDALEQHLGLLKHERIIESWHDRKIKPGSDWARQIDDNLKSADIILLLVSAAFLDSDYCYGIEMATAMERHERDEARVIPVILKPCDWQHAQFSELSALPADGHPRHVHAGR